MVVTLGDLLDDIPTQRIAGDPQVSITAVCTEPEQVVPGSLFVALSGSMLDGHRSLVEASGRGAAAALVESWPPSAAHFATTVQVRDTLAVLSPLAARFYGYPGESLGLIGVTGTDGKTTTTYLIETMLRVAGYRTGLRGTIAARAGETTLADRTRLTTPEASELQRMLAEMRAAAVEWAILETTSHALVLPRLDYCPFDIGVVTNVSQDHLDFHKSLAAYRSAKAQLLAKIDARPDRPYPRGVVLNADDDGVRAIADAAGSAPRIWFSSRGRQVDVTASRIEPDRYGTRFCLVTPSGSADVQLQLIGRFNVDNALAAAGVGVLLGLSPGQIAQGLSALKGVPGRQQRVDAGQPFLVMVDYAHTPAGVQRILELARGLVPGRVIAVVSTMGSRNHTKRPLLGMVGVQLADLAIFTPSEPFDEDPEQIIEHLAAGAVAAGGIEGRNYLRIPDRSTAIGYALDQARSGDAVVLTSKGHEPYFDSDPCRGPWDDIREARRALRLRGYDDSGGSLAHPDGIVV